MGRRVYIPNKSAHVFEAAKKFGDLVFVTEGKVSRFDAHAIWRAWNEVLKDSQPEDFIVVTALNILCTVGAAAFAAKHGRINLLLYRNGRYIRRELSLERRYENQQTAGGHCDHSDR